MIRGVRFVAGLLTSLVLILSFAERAWSSMCTPGMEAGAYSAATSAATNHGMPDHDCVAGHHDERSGQDAPDCPFSPAGTAQGCMAAASLPAAAAVEIALSPEGADLVNTSETEPRLLLGSALFHPPKA